MPQIWTSDNTDAVSRLKIQYGTSLVYPQIFMGAHVSAVPNHQVGRSTGIDMRANVAMMGNWGSELLHRGYFLPAFTGDFQSRSIYFTREVPIID